MMGAIAQVALSQTARAPAAATFCKPIFDDSFRRPAFAWSDSIANDKSPGRIIGLARNVDGKPLPDVVVSLKKGLSDTAQGRVTTSTPNGVFAFDTVRPGAYVLSTRRIGYLRQWHSTYLFGANVDTVCFFLKPDPIPIPPVGPARSDSLTA